jgi:hypothetical protein
MSFTVDIGIATSHRQHILNDTIDQARALTRPPLRS